MTRRTRLRLAAAAIVAALATSGCTQQPLPSVDDGRVRVVTTTGIVADFVQQVGGEHVAVTSLVPEGGDPHSYEPSLRNVRDIVYADIAFTNYLMLEEQRLISAIDANLPASSANIALAEEAVKYAANIIPLVEDASLDTVWLGFRAEGGAEAGVNRSASVELTARGMTGPGNMHAYLTGSFGDIDQYFNSTDGLRGDVEDTVSLPPDAHTHLSWAFSEPGIYELDLGARLRDPQNPQARDVASGTLVFAVGVNPHSVKGREDAVVLDSGHADVTVDLAGNRLHVLRDRDAGKRSDTTGRDYYDLDDVVVSIPNTALHEIPGDPHYRFLGNPGDKVYQLAQAVLGKHVHGEIDPHLWHDVHNAKAYVQIIRDQLIDADPAHAGDYTRNAASYLDELDALDQEIKATIDEIPKANRTLITTHDSFGYFASAYDMDIAGFISPNPAVEASLADRRRLTETIRNLKVPAVFLEPNLATRSNELTQIAETEGIRVCEILSDAFTRDVDSYIELMEFNVRSMRDCLGGA
ncbi:anchored repeat ABC transporter, substrate-binding protein [Gulosibacter bifidus]|uniref:Anchored repeat ABC transporter, substrate-binding protein n=1 Tax=Gulosibacter bifidus TaxID=272239 RepID=A0ABW5RK55_9MICO|nr:anchored repeat ABC transporter, substrate-binding protein [Gulosibacter bifidus]